MTDLRPYLVGRCEAFERFAERLAQLARSDATVLLCGESGSGKSAAARALHGLGSRARGPFVEVQLAALAPSLIEAELFGHELGAFTGAERARPGRFRQADAGTLVLDGVENLPLAAQVKLLRALQERVVEPLGASTAVPIDVRLIATTQRDLATEVRDGRFRADLYWRLAVVPLEVPPLRARVEDLEPLSGHLVALLAERHGVAPRALTREALARLAAHTWPGNVRELEHALERVLVLDRARTAANIEAQAFDFLVAHDGSAAQEVAARVLALGLSLGEVEKAVLELALREQRGNVSAAARRVGLSRRALEYRLAQRIPTERNSADRSSADGERGA